MQHVQLLARCIKSVYHLVLKHVTIMSQEDDALLNAGKVVSVPWEWSLMYRTKDVLIQVAILVAIV